MNQPQRRVVPLCAVLMALSSSAFGQDLKFASLCQTQSTSTSTAIVSNGEAYRVVQFLLKATF